MQLILGFWNFETIICPISDNLTQESVSLSWRHGRYLSFSLSAALSGLKYRLILVILDCYDAQYALTLEIP